MYPSIFLSPHTECHAWQTEGATGVSLLFLTVGSETVPELGILLAVACEYTGTLIHTLTLTLTQAYTPWLDVIKRQHGLMWRVWPHPPPVSSLTCDGHTGKQTPSKSSQALRADRGAGLWPRGRGRKESLGEVFQG